MVAPSAELRAQGCQVWREEREEEREMEQAACYGQCLRPHVQTAAAEEQEEAGREKQAGREVGGESEREGGRQPARAS